MKQKNCSCSFELSDGAPFFFRKHICKFSMKGDLFLNGEAIVQLRVETRRLSVVGLSGGRNQMSCVWTAQRQLVW